MASGVQVADECKDIYQQVKMNLSGKPKLRYAVFRISDNLKEVIVDKERMNSAADMGREEPAHFMEIVRGLPQDDGRYLVYDFPYQESYGPASKIILILWCPSGIGIKKKMVYASSKDSLKKCCSDIGAEFQADCADDLQQREIQAKLCRF